MWTRIGGRYSGVLAWAAVVLLISPAIAFSVMMRSIVPIAVVVGLLGVWVLMALVVYAPVIVLKVASMLRARRKVR